MIQKVQKWVIGDKLILTNIQQNPGETNKRGQLSCSVVKMKQMVALIISLLVE